LPLDSDDGDISDNMFLLVFEEKNGGLDYGISGIPSNHFLTKKPLTSNIEASGGSS
jgi:hypothetical protein